MKSFFSAFFGITACVTLVACAAAQKNKFDLYELRPTRTMPVDNDAYYVPPKSNHCTYSLSDAPSCGGI